MRHETAAKSSRVPIESGPRPAHERVAGLSFTVAAWVALMLASGSALAEPAPRPASPDPAAVAALARTSDDRDLPIAHATGLDALLALSPGDEPWTDVPGLSLQGYEDEATLADLLAVPGLSAMLSEAETADQAIALAVERGTNPDLEPKKPFRKRNVDLFRTERPVEIGRQEMIVRLRLRAKLKRAISVQLKF